MLQRCPHCAAVIRFDEQPIPAALACSSCSQSFTPQSESSGRVTLTRAQLKEHSELEDLVVLLVRIAADGVLEHSELQLLTDWLNNHVHMDVPAVKFLVEVILRVCADGQITPEEIYEIQLAIERVLPKEYRTNISAARQAVYYSQPASESQLATIQRFTGQCPAGSSRGQASEMLDRLYNGPSCRQLMLLRFWNKMEFATQTRDEVSQWIDSFMDDEHWAAWDRYKQEIGDDGSQRDPSFVPLGVGNDYLLKYRSREIFKQLMSERDAE
jgi:hypothetical protein